jgi:hypothetical protein
MEFKHGIYIANLNQDLDLVYFSGSKTIGIYYSVKPITSNSPKWKHGTPLCDELIECKHPRIWNRYSDDAHKVKKICEEHGYSEIDERMIIRAIGEIVSDIDIVKHKMINKNKKISKPEPFHATCNDCECYGCFKINNCGDCR